MKTFVLGDVHGAFPALKQVLELSKFDKEKDRLICLGDVCDGFPYVKECFDELLTIKDLTYIMGNHDWWAYQYYGARKPAEEYWLKQGGVNTMKSYPDGMPDSHLQLLANAEYFIKENNTVFVHGGIDPNKPLDRQYKEELIWDRHLLQSARTKHFQNPDYKYGGYDTIFVGHTTTQSFKTDLPVRFCNVVDIDTGAGWNGKLTIMDVKTGKFWQSDNVLDLMPGVEGRQRLRFE